MMGMAKSRQSLRAVVLVVSLVTTAAYGQPRVEDEHRHNCQHYAEHDRYTPQALNGCYAWYLWTGGTEYMWRELARRGIADILEIAASGRVTRAERWREFGLINDPACRPAQQPDRYGLRFDQCVDDGPSKEGRPAFPGEPSGVIGLRKFPNPKFEPAPWDLARYLAGDKSIEPPFLLGTTCAVCHATLNPGSPPADPAE